MSDRTRGLFEKFIVRRTDGTSGAGQKHDGCEYFVLDMTHDPYAKSAAQAYVDACKADYPLLAADMVRDFKLRAEAPTTDTGALMVRDMESRVQELNGQAEVHRKMREWGHEESTQARANEVWKWLTRLKSLRAEALPPTENEAK